MTMFRLRPIPRNTSTSMIWRPSSCTTGSAGEQPNHSVEVPPQRERPRPVGEHGGYEVGHPHAPAHDVELTCAEQVAQHDLRRLRQRYGVQVGDARQHGAVHLHRDHRRTGARCMNDRMTICARFVVHLLARRGDAHAQHVLERLFRGNGRSSRGDGRTSVWRSSMNAASPRPTTRAATLAAAVGALHTERRHAAQGRSPAQGPRRRSPRSWPGWPP